MRTNLQTARQERGLTQEQVANAVGITARQYRNIESGNFDGRMKVWKQLRKLLGHSIDYLEK